MVKETSLCGLGQSAPNPVLSTLRFFRHEYEKLLNKPEAYIPSSQPQEKTTVA
jgi:NADH:ubiquinone oxidoreductase subunit F (NADH-binding)